MTITRISNFDTQLANLRKFMRGVTFDEWAEGERWYHDTYLWCIGVQQSMTLRALPVWKICGVVAALSPRTTWERNKEMAESIIMMWDRHTNLDVIREATPAFKHNVNKAIDILEMPASSSSDDVPAILNGNKTIAFFENILHPERAVLVTVDTWIYRVLENDASASVDTIKDEAYEQMENIIFQVANDDYDVIGSVLQAVVWVSVRNRYAHALRTAKSLVKV